MGKIRNLAVVGVSIIGGALGIELGAIGGEALYNDVLFVTGNAPHPVYKEGMIFKKYTRVNPYNGKKTRVIYNKKTRSFIAASRQPKGYVKD